MKFSHRFCVHVSNNIIRKSLRFFSLPKLNRNCMTKEHILKTTTREPNDGRNNNNSGEQHKQFCLLVLSLPSLCIFFSFRSFNSKWPHKITSYLFSHIVLMHVLKHNTRKHIAQIYLACDAIQKMLCYAIRQEVVKKCMYNNTATQHTTIDIHLTENLTHILIHKH